MPMSDISSVLWDIRPSEISSLPDTFVIRRALVHGGLLLVSSIIARYGIDTVRSTFGTMKPTTMSNRRYAYFKNYLLA